MFSLPGQVNKITLQVREYLLQAEDVHQTVVNKYIHVPIDIHTNI
jgi:hypothetical protein